MQPLVSKVVRIHLHSFLRGWALELLDEAGCYIR